MGRSALPWRCYFFGGPACMRQGVGCMKTLARLHQRAGTAPPAAHVCSHAFPRLSSWSCALAPALWLPACGQMGRPMRCCDPVYRLAGINVRSAGAYVARCLLRCTDSLHAQTWDCCEFWSRSVSQMHRLAAMAEGAGANTPNTSPCCACICATPTAWETDAITETHWPSWCLPQSLADTLPCYTLVVRPCLGVNTQIVRPEQVVSAQHACSLMVATEHSMRRP